MKNDKYPCEPVLASIELLNFIKEELLSTHIPVEDEDGDEPKPYTVTVEQQSHLVPNESPRQVLNTPATS